MAKIKGRDYVSIRSPDRSQGRSRPLLMVGPGVLVSIRSPDRSQGRFSAEPRPQAGLLVFQSAPLTEARGDFHAVESIHDRLQVSIRSPDRSQGR